MNTTLHTNQPSKVTDSLAQKGNPQLVRNNTKLENYFKKGISLLPGLILILLNFGTAIADPNSTTHDAHDFSAEIWNTYNYTTTLGQQLCQPCHTPHNANLSVTEAPLWNHELSTANYTFFESIKDQSNLGVTAIDGTSKLCLACHDGTVALGSFGGQVGTQYITGGYNFSADLRNDHPVSVDYLQALSGGYGDLHQTTHLFSTYDTLNLTYVAGSQPVSAMLDASGKVQCTSCHSAHSNSTPYLMKMDNRGSALCLACHNK
ncbi:MAG: hypothetical protein IPP38_07500 [Bacteroidetes bacterium]|nr:hypothetical protein [Bacteroidota bacterium]